MAKNYAPFDNVFDDFNKESEPSSSKKKSSREPSAEEHMFAASARNIAAKWSSDENMKLVWTSSADLFELAKTYTQQLNNGASKQECNRTRQKIKRTFNALVYLLKANYPDEYHTELKHWGFSKEKY
jgi:hypothetical protein